jgi:hypothetical protein
MNKRLNVTGAGLQPFGKPAYDLKLIKKIEISHIHTLKLLSW